MLGTAAYISPEQAVGDPATAASDRYALAVVAYELLTGQRPFEAENFAAQARAHVEDDPVPASERNPDLPPEVDAVLARGLDKEPGARYAERRRARRRARRRDDRAAPPPPTDAAAPASPAAARRRRTAPAAARRRPRPAAARTPACCWRRWPRSR